jgi:hypothetical protein
MIRRPRSVVAKVASLLCLSLVLGIPVTELNQRTLLSANTGLQDPLAKFDESVNALMNLYGQFSELSAARFESTKQREDVQDSVEDIVRILDFIRKEMRANKLRKDGDVVDQLNGMAELMVMMLNDLKDSSARLKKDDRKRIEQIRADLQRKMSNINELKGVEPNEQSYDRGIVKVKTVKQNGVEEPLLTIYYVPQVHFGSRLQDLNTKSFGALSPTDDSLLEADYYVWAGKADSKTPLTNVKDCEARKAQPKNLTLVIK